MLYKMTDLLNLALATPHIGMINCFMLHTLLHAMIKRLDIGDAKVQIPDKRDNTINYQKDPARKDIKVTVTQPKPVSETATKVKKEARPEEPAKADETRVTQSHKNVSDVDKQEKKVPEGSEVSEVLEVSEVSEVLEVPEETGPPVIDSPRHSNAGQASKSESVKNSEEDLSESSKPSANGSPKGFTDHPSIDAMSEETTSGIPYLELKYNEIVEKLNSYPTTESIEKLVKLLEYHSPIEKDTDTQVYINETSVCVF